MTADWQLSDLTDYVISDDGLQLTFDVTAGEDYRLGLGTGAGVGHYRLSFAGAADALPEVVDLDTITQARFDGQAFTVDGAYYAATAARHGLFTVEALFNDAAATTAQLELYDAAWNHIATGAAASSDAATEVIHRADVTLAAGETLFVRIAGGEAATVKGRVDLRLTNLLSVDDDEATLFGTPGADDVTLRMGATHLLSIGGVEYALDADRVTSINVLTDGDHDTLVLYGTDADEHIRLAVGGVVMVGDGWTATALGVEEITVHGGGGRDVGELHDSVAADTFTARPGWAEMVGGGYHNRLFGADDVHAHATHGGSDVARLYDSLGNDALTADPTSARLDGTGFRLEASGFSQVHAYSLGGQDTATLRDSAGDDRLTADATQAVLEGAGFLNRARGFEQVTVRATGGDDRAELHDSADDDVLVARPTSVALFTPTTTVQVLAFDRVDAFSTQGDDVARLIDSAENDRFTATKGQSTMIGPGYHNCVVGFGETHGYAVHGGLDTAVLLRSGDSDSFQNDGDVARLTGDGFDLRAAYFEQLSADAQDGTDQARLADSPGDDHSAAARITATLEASRATVWALAFESITASPDRGGHDRSEIAAVDYALELMGDYSPG